MACLAVLLATVPDTSKAAVEVQAVRVGLDTEHTRLVLESDKPIRARMERDARTGALVVDLDDVSMGQTLAGLGKAIGANNPFIAGVRLSPTGTGTRMELTAPTSITPRIFNLRSGGGHADRLVMDFYRDPAEPGQENSTVGLIPSDAAATPAATGVVHVSTVQAALVPDRIRLVLESDRPIQARVINPTEPGETLAVDLGDVVLDAVLQSLSDKIRRNPFLTSIRFSRDAAVTRMDLTTPTAIALQIFHLAPVNNHTYRLVVDIVPTVTMSVPPLDTPPASVDAVSSTAVATPAPMPPAPVAAPPQNTSDSLTEAWFEVHVNGMPEDTVLVLQDANRNVLVRAADLERWRIPVADVAVVTHGADDYLPLSAIAGLTYRIDSSQGTLLLDVSASRFAATHFSGISRAADQPMPSPPGGYVNYDIFGARGAHGSSHVNALLDAGVFGSWGSGSSTFLARHRDGSNRTLRLDTTWTHDRPADMASLRFGDVISAPSSWGRGVRFGGVQWGTNFATQPGFISFPLPTLDGVAAEPSTVDFYVNNVLRLRRNVPSGPFTIQDLPIVTGQGDIRMVVRDMLGREQVVTQPFYASGGLLAAGLRDYSYELGFERENYGRVSNDYGRLVAAATERRGFSDSFTGELHVEATHDQQTLGIGSTVLLGNVGVLTASVAGSHDRAGTGALMELGIQHQSRYLSYGARTRVTTDGFTQLGYLPTTHPPRQTSSAFVSMSAGRVGSLSLNYTYQDLRDQDDVELVGLSYSRSLGWLGYLSLSALRFLGDDPAPLFSLNLTVPLGAADSVSFSGQSRASDSHGSVQYRRSLPVGTGVGYRLQAGLAANDPRQADLTLQNDVGTYSVGVASNPDGQAYRMGVRGGIALLSGKVFPSRHIDGSFAVVQVPGFADVRVYADNQQVATTDSDGYALVPRLRPYQKNPIRIEQADLPMDAQITGLQLDAVPYYQSALALTFPVTRSRGAIVVIKLDDGSALPAGAEVTVDGSTMAFPVGLRGEVYLTGLDETSRLHATWNGQSCDMTISFPDTNDPLPRLGPVTCQGIDP
ncbi:fimbria/pilus outer membrane usher protein [Rhodanobacter sp. Root627]|uniref:fimbria/pilus outer membrane usher protein n=1 Tax=Rhodanobacter sp. Root627 TaxID=1736572 RepID=UPI00138F6473|nr:fimbria/pilus outer membrane usher protein [Rhodanobacter sp. Root627]